MLNESKYEIPSATSRRTSRPIFYFLWLLKQPKRERAKRMIKGAQFSDCRKYRYALWRTWNAGECQVTFIGLNPSTADEDTDDPTIRRCIGFAKKWGFGGINMLNLFAYRATDPKVLMRAPVNPIGKANNDFLKMYHTPAGLSVACWGQHGLLMNRGDEVIEMLGKNTLSCLGVTKKGQPKHPLYLPKDTAPMLLSLFDEVQK